jgi:hypothetical protein
MSTTDKAQIAQDILRYLVAHPGAQDTIEGIYEWWLLEEDIARRIADVNEALAELIGDGLLVESKGADSRTHYRVNQVRLSQIMARLGQNDNRACEGDGGAGC